MYKSRALECKVYQASNSAFRSENPTLPQMGQIAAKYGESEDDSNSLPSNPDIYCQTKLYGVKLRSAPY